MAEMQQYARAVGKARSALQRRMETIEETLQADIPATYRRDLQMEYGRLIQVEAPPMPSRTNWSGHTPEEVVRHLRNGSVAPQN